MLGSAGRRQPRPRGAAGHCGPRRPCQRSHDAGVSGNGRRTCPPSETKLKEKTSTAGAAPRGTGRPRDDGDICSQMTGQAGQGPAGCLGPLGRGSLLREGAWGPEPRPSAAEGLGTSLGSCTWRGPKARGAPGEPPALIASVNTREAAGDPRQSDKNNPLLSNTGQGFPK